MDILFLLFILRHEKICNLFLFKKLWIRIAKNGNYEHRRYLLSNDCYINDSFREKIYEIILDNKKEDDPEWFWSFSVECHIAFSTKSIKTMRRLLKSTYCDTRWYLACNRYAPNEILYELATDKYMKVRMAILRRYNIKDIDKEILINMLNDSCENIICKYDNYTDDPWVDEDTRKRYIESDIKKYYEKINEILKMFEE